jgi:hypothetical protein
MVSPPDLEEHDMSTRKPTIDDLDDVDDEDGVLEEEVVQETDLTLIVETADEVLMGSDPKLEGPINPDELEDELNTEPNEEEA